MSKIEVLREYREKDVPVYYLQKLGNHGPDDWRDSANGTFPTFEEADKEAKNLIFLGIEKGVRVVGRNLPHGSFVL